MTTHSQDDLKDDEVLAQLYKEGAKDTPPAKLNHEIIHYAANADKSSSSPSHVGSHFGGGWKVPLSMAASVVVVFALLVQLDQNSQHLELPPIPEITIPTEQKSTKSKDRALKSQPAPEQLYEAEESLADDISSFKKDANESDMDSQDADARITDKPVRKESQPIDTIQTERISNKKAEQKLETYRERTQTQSTINNEPSITPKPKSTEGYAPKLTKPQAAGKQMHEPSNGTLGSSSEAAPNEVIQQRSMGEKSMPSREDTHTSSGMAADAELGIDEKQNENEFAPIPVEDWLLMIERLVARKDYAEASRQLVKFKQMHPNVNVEDLDAKIP
ncbi:MAG: hypothetical protein GKR92_13460 [Gammaproteobacteria bacterium]|nr:MAG: hypothetical protein GKR92_00090 [Gammaproteobacteria bacterium]QMU62653.1 MAG: hypothetical protein GKR92_13460 [Gammaproteobacteria bacterium]